MQGIWDTHPHLKDDLEKVEAVMESGLRSRNPTVAEAVDKLLSRKGKMLRPGLVLLSARMKPGIGFAGSTGFAGSAGYAGPRKAGGSSGADCSAGTPGDEPLPEKIYRIAAAVEIMHIATLVHDDIIDRASVRRGAPSLNARYGDRTAVLLGDFLFSRCFSLVAEHASTANARFLAAAVSHICDSEIAQSRRFDPATLSVRDYLRRITGKTAALFALSCHIGASENGVPGETVALLRRVGHNVGLTFQIVDDLLDFTGDEKTLGKPAGGDLREGIFTLPVIHAYRRNPAALGPLLNPPALRNGKTAARAMDMIRSSGGLDETRKTAALFTARALRETEKLPPSPSRRTLHRIVESLPARTF